MKHQGNATKNYSEIYYTFVLKGQNFKRLVISTIGKDLEELKPSHTTG